MPNKSSKSVKSLKANASTLVSNHMSERFGACQLSNEGFTSIFCHSFFNDYVNAGDIDFLADFRDLRAFAVRTLSAICNPELSTLLKQFNLFSDLVAHCEKVIEFTCSAAESEVVKDELKLAQLSFVPDVSDREEDIKLISGIVRNLQSKRQSSKKTNAA